MTTVAGSWGAGGMFFCVCVFCFFLFFFFFFKKPFLVSDCWYNYMYGHAITGNTVEGTLSFTTHYIQTR